MRPYHAKNIRNIAIVGHNSVGKTLLIDSMAYYNERITRLGSVEDGTTISDYSNEEIEKKYSIRSSLAALEYKNTKLNLIDCPGYADFIGESYGAIRVADTVLITVAANSTQGCDVGTEKGFEIAKKLNKPVAFFINKCDMENANFSKVVQTLKDEFTSSVNEMQFPLLDGNKLEGVIDIVDMKLYVIENGKKTAKEIPDQYKEKAAKMRSDLIENIAGSDEELMEKYFENGDLSDEDFAEGFKKAFVEGMINPVFCGSAITEIGVASLMEKFVSIFLSPLENKIHGIKGEENYDFVIDETHPFSGFVFKTVSESHVGELYFFKVMSGNLKSGMEVKNNGNTERMGQIFFVTGKNKLETKEINAGDIGAVVKLKKTKTNDTLYANGVDYKIRPINLPSPLIWEAVNTKDKKDDAKIGQALTALANEDPTFGYEINPELHQTIIHGQGVKHIDTVMNLLKDRYRIEVDLIEPKIPYRETITKNVEGSYRHRKQSGGKGQFGEVHMRMKPRERGEGYEFKNSVVGGSIPSRFIPAVEKGIAETLVEGVISGSKVIDVEVDLFFGKFHDVDSSEMAFKIASRTCFKNLFKEAKPILLEPVNDIKITCPEEFTGDIMGDISSKRGRPEGMETKGKKQIITAKVPLSELYRYSTTLRTMTQGKGTYETEFSHYELVPHDVQAKIVDKHEALNGHEEEE